MYGSPLNYSNSEAKTKMNENPEMASNWKGRILMQVTCEPTDKPIIKDCAIPDEVISEARAYMRDRSFDVIAEIGQAVALPIAKQYTVKLIIGGKEFRTGLPRSSTKNYNRFNHRFE